MKGSHECAICLTVQECIYGVVRWSLEKHGLGSYFTDDWRCVDRKACRARVEASKKEWPVTDSPEVPA